MPTTITYTGTIAQRRRLALYDLEQYLGRPQLHRLIHGLYASCNWDDGDHSADPQLHDFIRTIQIQFDLMLGVSGLPVLALLEFVGFPPQEALAEIEHEIYHRNAPAADAPCSQCGRPFTKDPSPHPMDDTSVCASCYFDMNMAFHKMPDSSEDNGY